MKCDSKKPTEKQVKYILSLGDKCKLKVNVSKFLNLNEASFLIEWLKIYQLFKPSNGSMQEFDFIAWEATWAMVFKTASLKNQFPTWAEMEIKMSILLLKIKGIFQPLDEGTNLPVLQGLIRYSFQNKRR